MSTLLERLIAEVEAAGFYRVSDDDIPPNFTLWTCDEWREWWHDPKNMEARGRDREAVLLDVIADLVGLESGWGSIRCQPEPT